MIHQQTYKIYHAGQARKGEWVYWDGKYGEGCACHIYEDMLGRLTVWFQETGNKVSRKSIITGSQNIILGGKVQIQASKRSLTQLTRKRRSSKLNVLFVVTFAGQSPPLVPAPVEVAETLPLLSDGTASSPDQVFFAHRAKRSRDNSAIIPWKSEITCSLEREVWLRLQSLGAGSK